MRGSLKGIHSSKAPLHMHSLACSASSQSEDHGAIWPWTQINLSSFCLSQKFCHSGGIKLTMKTGICLRRQLYTFPRTILWKTDLRKIPKLLLLKYVEQNQKGRRGIF